VVLALAAVFITGMVVAQVIFPLKYIYVTVEEAITVTPESILVTMYPGETKTANFTVHNIASVNIPLTILAEVTAYPTLGDPTHLTLTSPEFSAAPGDTTLSIQIVAATATVPGDYTITVTVTRV